MSITVALIEVLSDFAHELESTAAELATTRPRASTAWLGAAREMRKVIARVSRGEAFPRDTYWQQAMFEGLLGPVRFPNIDADGLETAAAMERSSEALIELVQDCADDASHAEVVQSLEPLEDRCTAAHGEVLLLLATGHAIDREPRLPRLALVDELRRQQVG